MDRLEETKVRGNLIYDGRIMQVYNDEIRLPDGRSAYREYVNHSGGCAMLAVDMDDNVYLVEQYRYPYGERVLEIPAGKREVGEDPKLCAIRELGEECGLKAEQVDELGILYPTVGYSNEKIYIYLGRGLSKTDAHLDDGEFLAVRKFPFDKAYAMAMDGTIKDAKTVVALLKYAALYRK
ncbi:MAG: NUDIX hydrolase [Clostridia bacterium]|nr:NUDIX hydrolase [Clostridia bacterium]